MGNLLSRRTVFFVTLSLFVSSRLVLAQDTADYDSEYDDEIAAGEFGYNDTQDAEEPVADDNRATDPVWEDENPDSDGEDKRAKLKPWEWGAYRHHSNIYGPTGLLRIVQAGSDEGGTFGVGFHASFFKYSDYLYYGDENSYMWGGLNIRVTPIEHLEISAGFQSMANHNTKVKPELFQTLGDFQLDIKGYFTAPDWLTLGAIFGVSFLNPVGEVDMSLEGTSFKIGLLSTFDFSEVNEKAPIQLHVNAGYYFDRSANLIDGIEKQRGGCGTDIDGDGLRDYDGCLNPVERTALKIDRNDNFNIGIGIDVLFPYVTPIIEYWIEIPINRQGFTCPESVPYSQDSCLHREGAASMRQWLTFGVRVLLPMDSLALDVGVDWGLSGYAPSVHELTAQPPYQVILGLSYSFDPFPEKVEAAPPLEPLAPLAPLALPPVIVGIVHEAGASNIPIPGAEVSYLGQNFNSQVTGPDGRFRSYPLTPGPITVSVTAKGYQDGSFNVEIPDPDLELLPYDETDMTKSSDGMDESAPQDESDPVAGTQPYDEPKPFEVKLDCPLKPLDMKGSILVTVLDEQGNPLSGVTVKYDGPVSDEIVTGTDGKVDQEIDEGSYTLSAQKEGYVTENRTVEATLDGVTEIRLQLGKVAGQEPKVTNVVIRRKRIVIKKKIHFATNSDEIKDDSLGLMNEIASVIKSHSELKLIQIQGHSDNRGRRKHNIDLSARRVQAVRQYLIKAGVDGSRLDTKGFGPDRPIAPNITSQGRARNRRVEFHIKEQD